MPDGPTRLSIGALNKTFGASRVLSDVELTVRAGEIHGLAGQNGSGKSTLIKILTGLYTPDPGARYEVDGQPMRLPARWREVHAAGVSVVHQDLGLLDRLTVAENVCVGGFPTRGWLRRIDRRRRDDLTFRTLTRLGLDISPHALVDTLSAPERAAVAIARAMRDYTTGTGLVILDESTRALSGEELGNIHELLRRIAREGSSVLLISHNLVELVAVTHRITVLRDGRVVGAGLDTSALNEQDVARFMLGSTVQSLSARAAKSPRALAVRVDGLQGDALENVSFSIGRGEILGITGMPGSGYESIAYLVTGARRARAGEMQAGYRKLDLADAGVAACLRLGVVLVPERRDRDGLAFELSVRDNIALPLLRRRGKPWFVARAWQQDTAATAARTLGVHPSQPSILVKQLSGGNQQKVLLAKWLSTGPALLVLHEPTQAVDVGARRDILLSLQRAADSGVAVLLVSSEPEDLIAACDRILVYREGRGLQESDAATPEALLDQIYSTTDETETEVASRT